MGSSGQPDRSLGGGISLPQWMKNKMDARLDFDESAFSPPAYDDNFFYVRHSRNENPASIQQGGFRSIGEIPSERKNGGGDVVTSTNQATSDLKSIKQIDFSKHPLPCQPFVPSASDVKPPKLVVAGSAKIKSQGTDDGFHSEPALCGKYIVHVANQLMMSSKIGAVSSKSHNEEVESVPKMGSKSLPATPLTSPMTTPDISPKLVVICGCLLAAARAGVIGGGLLAATAPTASVALHPAVALPTVATSSSSSSNIIRGIGNLGTISAYSKSVDTAFSSVRKADVRVNNPGVTRIVAATTVPAVAVTNTALAGAALPLTTALTAPAALTTAVAAAPTAITTGLAAPSIAASALGLNGLALNGLGVNALGVNALGVNGLGVNGLGVNGLGLNGLGLNGLGLGAVKVHL